MIQVTAPGAPQLARDLDQAATELEDLGPVADALAARIAGRARHEAPVLSGALAAGTTAHGSAIAVTGIAGDYVHFVRFGTGRMDGRDYIADAINPEEAQQLLDDHLDTTTKPLEKNYG